MLRRKVPRTTLIRKAPGSVISPLGRFLDDGPMGPWRQLAEVLVCPFDPEVPLFNADDITLLEREFYFRGSPTKKMIEELMFKEATISDLIEACKLAGPELERCWRHLEDSCTDDPAGPSDSKGDQKQKPEVEQRVPPPPHPAREPPPALPPRRRGEPRPSPSTPGSTSTWSDTSYPQTPNSNFSYPPSYPPSEFSDGSSSTGTGRSYATQGSLNVEYSSNPSIEARATPPPRPHRSPRPPETPPYVTRNYPPLPPRESERLLGKAPEGCPSEDGGSLRTSSFPDDSFSSVGSAVTVIGMARGGKDSTPVSLSNISVAVPSVDVSEHSSVLESLATAVYTYEELSQATGQFNEKPRAEGGSRIGQGGFGSVYYGKLESVREAIAVKVLDNDGVDSAALVKKQFMSELKNFSCLRHKNVMPLLGYSCDGLYLCLVYAFIPGGSLEDRLQQPAEGKGGRTLTVEERLSIALGSAEGIAFIHSQKLVHRDIKSANILLDEDLTPRIGDFGLSRAGGGVTGRTQAQTAEVIGTTAYMPHEAMQGKVSPLWDSYSFGIVIMELLTALPAYDEDRDEAPLPQLVDAYEEKIEELVDRNAGAWPDALIKGMFALYSGLTDHSVKKRWTIAKALEQLAELQDSLG